MKVKDCEGIMRKRGSGRKPFKTITIPANIYDDLKSFFEEHELELRRMGITSLSGLACKFLLEGFENLRKRLEAHSSS